jgi:glucitol/sorbitol PTS system EIIC component
MIMDILARGAEGFIGLFQQGGETFVGLVTGILPTLIVLITFVNAIVKIIGEDRVQNVAKKATKNVVTRYTLLPLLSVFFLTNPMCYTFGKFLDEKYKPAFYDATVSFVHPITGLFPHANPAELFVYLGIAEGIKQLGLPLGQLAIRYFLVGLIVIFMRGMVTEVITARMLGKKMK